MSLLNCSGEFLLDESVQDPVHPAYVVPHHRLPVRVVLVLASWLGADVGLLGGKLGGDPLLEVDPGQVILQVSVGVPGCGLEMTNSAGWDTLLIPVYPWFSNDQIKIIALSF